MEGIENGGAEDFQVVTRHSVEQTTTRGERQGEITPLANSFNMLLEEGGIRGLNSPNKQEDVKIFLHQQQVGLVGFFETKVKLENIAQVMGSQCNIDRQRKNYSQLASKKVEGFDVVADVMTGYYKDLFGKKEHYRTQMTGIEQCIKSLTKLQMPRTMKAVLYAMINAVIYHIWMARNKLMLKDQTYLAKKILKEAREQITQRILHLQQHSQKYTTSIEYMLYRK
ncbi:hypothetical protein Cgig2_011784 [Carnegiea gigantea]|uniref:Uncharacterized protein n=1 Tax=Carnegiea gigantea TaxID=171969 RepID=A0A9Q1Q5B7_9CARY|nr:hypothetical protein Cgig2_011784 [Carnegiea gigantea]